MKVSVILNHLFQNKSQSSKPSSDCGSVYGEERVAASMVCAGWPEGGRDSCQVVSVMVVDGGAVGEGGDQHHHHNFVQAGLRGEGASCQVIVIIHDYHNGDDQQHHDLHHQVLSVMILITSCSVSLPILIIIMIIRIIKIIKIIMIINVFSRVTPADL